MTRCEYCGAYISFQDNIPTIHSKFNCSNCGTALGKGSLICINCGQLLTQNQNEIESLKGIQRRLLFLQQKIRNQLSPIVAQNLFSEEYFLFYEQLASKTELAVTDKRLLSYFPPGPNPERLTIIPYENIVEIGPITSFPQWVNELSLARIGTILYKINLTTFDGSEVVMVSDASGFHKAIKSAFENYLHKRKNVNAILCSLKL
jgi:hypothetical protein